MSTQMKTEESEQYKLDEIDRRVLDVYQRDASLSYKELSNAVELPPSTIYDRIKKLRRNGTIKTVIPLLDYEKLGLLTTAWVLIKISREKGLERVAENVTRIHGVMEVHGIAGEYDIMVKVKVRDNLELHTTTDLIARLEGVHDTFSTMALCTIKEDIRISV